MFNGVECHWSFDLIDLEGVVTEHIDWQKNTVLDDGLLSLITPNITPFYGTNGGLYANIAVGSGTTAPRTDNHQLESFMTAKVIDLTNSSGTFVDATSNYKPIVYTYSTTFAANEAVGSIAEVGLTSSLTNTSGSYFCRNLVRSGQTPSPFTKDSSHLLRVFLKISINRPQDNCYWTAEDLVMAPWLSGTTNVTGCTNNQWLIQSVTQSSVYSTGRYVSGTMAAVASTGYATVPADANIYSSALPTPVNGNASGAITASGTIDTYNGGALDGSNTNYEFDKVYYTDLRVVIPNAELNMNIRSLFIKGFFQQPTVSGVTGDGGLFLQFDPVLAKDIGKKLVINLRHYWGRI